MAQKKKPAMSPSDMPVSEVLDRATGPRRAEVDELLELFQKISGEEPVVWAGRIVGFGQYEYRYESGHSGTAPLMAFAPGATKHTVYLPTNYAENWPDLVGRLGKCKTSKACLYFTRLTDLDLDVLRELLTVSLQHTLETAGE